MRGKGSIVKGGFGKSTAKDNRTRMENRLLGLGELLKTESAVRSTMKGGYGRPSIRIGGDIKH